MGDQHAADRNVLPFVLEGVKIEVRELPATPAIKLYLMADDYPQESLPQMDYQRLMSAPPYWAFCWGGGQALAQWILNHPELVRGQAVVDFGAGSGIAGIAAALAGAKSVLCVDVDPGALCACQRNATLNDVAIATSDRMQNLDGALLLAADVCYEDEGYAGVINHVINGGRAIVAESRLRDLSQRFPQLREVSTFKVRTLPDLQESENYDSVHIFSSHTTAQTG